MYTTKRKPITVEEGENKYEESLRVCYKDYTKLHKKEKKNTEVEEMP